MADRDPHKSIRKRTGRKPPRAGEQTPDYDVPVACASELCFQRRESKFWCTHSWNLDGKTYYKPVRSNYPGAVCCPICNFHYSTKYMLVLHMSLAHLTGMWTCTGCGRCKCRERIGDFKDHRCNRAEFIFYRRTYREVHNRAVEATGWLPAQVTKVLQPHEDVTDNVAIDWPAPLDEWVGNKRGYRSQPGEGSPSRTGGSAVHARSSTSRKSSSKYETEERRESTSKSGGDETSTTKRKCTFSRREEETTRKAAKVCLERMGALADDPTLEAPHDADYQPSSSASERENEASERENEPFISPHCGGPERRKKSESSYTFKPSKLSGDKPRTIATSASSGRSSLLKPISSSDSVTAESNPIGSALEKTKVSPPRTIAIQGHGKTQTIQISVPNPKTGEKTLMDVTVLYPNEEEIARTVDLEVPETDTSRPVMEPPQEIPKSSEVEHPSEIQDTAMSDSDPDDAVSVEPPQEIEETKDSGMESVTPSSAKPKSEAEEKIGSDVHEAEPASVESSPEAEDKAELGPQVAEVASVKSTQEAEDKIDPDFLATSSQETEEIVNPDPLPDKAPIAEPLQAAEESTVPGTSSSKPKITRGKAKNKTNRPNEDELPSMTAWPPGYEGKIPEHFRRVKTTPPTPEEMAEIRDQCTMVNLQSWPHYSISTQVARSDVPCYTFPVIWKVNHSISMMQIPKAFGDPGLVFDAFPELMPYCNGPPLHRMSGNWFTSQGCLAYFEGDHFSRYRLRPPYPMSSERDLDFIPGQTQGQSPPSVQPTQEDIPTDTEPKMKKDD